MIKPYILMFDDSQITREEVVELIDSNPKIVNWNAFLPAAIALVSEDTAKALCDDINGRRSKIFRYVLMRVTERGGWAQKSVWEFLRHPQAVE